MDVSLLDLFEKKRTGERTVGLSFDHGLPCPYGSNRIRGRSPVREIPADLSSPLFYRFTTSVYKVVS